MAVEPLNLEMEPQMKSKVLRYMAAAGVGAVTATSLLVIGSVAGASGTPTTTTVTGVPSSSTPAGAAVTLTATVAPAHAPTATGSVTFTVTGADSSSLSCTGGNTVNLAGGKARCKIAAGLTTVAGSPYGVTAVYSGDANYAGSTGTSSQIVTQNTIKMRLTDPTKPSNGGAAVLVAKLTGPKGAVIPGSVLFAVASGYPKHIRPVCTGGQLVPVVNNTATCDLAAGWITVPAPTGAVPHPKTNWSVSASYLGNSSFVASGTATKQGLVRQ